MHIVKQCQKRNLSYSSSLLHRMFELKTKPNHPIGSCFTFMVLFIHPNFDQQAEHKFSIKAGIF